MNIKIRETGEAKELFLSNLNSGENMVSDFIGDCDDLEYNNKTDEYEMDQESFDYWEEAVEKQAKISLLEKDILLSDGAKNKYFEAYKNQTNDLDILQDIQLNWLQEKFNANMPTE